MAWSKTLLLAVALCGAALGAPEDEGYSYPEPVNGLYLPPPPDEGGPINPGGSDNYETGLKLPEPVTTTTRRPTTTRKPYRPPSTQPPRPRPTYRPRPTTTPRPRPTTTRPRPTYRPRPTTTARPRPTTTRPRPTYRPRPTTTPRPRPTTTRPRPTYRPRPTTTPRPRPTTTRPRPTYRPRPVPTSRPTYGPNLIPDGSGPSGSGVPFPTTRKPFTTAAPQTGGSKMMHMSRPYEFGYDVDDPNENNAFSQKETSDGMVITGEYRWNMPDGRTQIVTYLADWAKGYYADVRYE